MTKTSLALSAAALLVASLIAAQPASASHRHHRSTQALQAYAYAPAAPAYPVESAAPIDTSNMIKSYASDGPYYYCVGCFEPSGCRWIGHIKVCS